MHQKLIISLYIILLKTSLHESELGYNLVDLIPFLLKQ